MAKIEVHSNNGIYRVYQYDDGNGPAKIEIYEVLNTQVKPVKNMDSVLKKLNDEFSYKIDFNPVYRIRLNTREFGNEFIKRFQKRNNCF